MMEHGLGLAIVVNLTDLVSKFFCVWLRQCNPQLPLSCSFPGALGDFFGGSDSQQTPHWCLE